MAKKAARKGRPKAGLKASSRRKAAKPKARKSRAGPKKSRARAWPKSRPAMPAADTGVPREKISLLVGTGSFPSGRPLHPEPQSDRCAECGASFSGLLSRLLGIRRSEANPRICNKCEKKLAGKP